MDGVHASTAAPDDRPDVTIVGGGMAGLEVAAHLVEHGVAVLVLESGAEGDTRHDGVVLGHDGALRRWLAPETDPHFFRPWTPLTPPHYTGPSGLRRRVGGRSLYWYGVCLPVDSWALDAWPPEVVSDLTTEWRGGPGLYDLTRAMLAQWAPTAAASSAGPSIAGHSFRPVPRAVRRSTTAPGRWSAYSPLDRWRDPDVAGPLALPAGLTVRTGSHVHALRRDGMGYILDMGELEGTVTGEIRTPRVVLAAGTLENARLVMGTGVVDDRPGGPLSRLNDHIVQGFFLRVPADEHARVHEVLPTGSYYSPGDRDTRSNLFFDVAAVSDGTVLIDVRATGEQRPDSRSYISGAGTGSGSALGVAVHLTDDDDRLIARQRRMLEAVWHDVAASLALPAAPLTFGDFDSPERVNAFVLPEHIGSAPVGTALTWSSYVGVEDHEAGTLPLGPVLSDSHEVRGLPDVYVAGPAGFPRMGAANPTLTTLALARRLAAAVGDRLDTHTPTQVTAS